MKIRSWIKGVGLGVIAGAAIAVAVMPIDNRKLRHSKPAKAIRAFGHALGDITHSFM